MFVCNRACVLMCANVRVDASGCLYIRMYVCSYACVQTCFRQGSSWMQTHECALAHRQMHALRYVYTNERAYKRSFEQTHR